MTDQPSWLTREGSDLILRLRIQPRASRDEVIGEHGDALKVRITAPPVDGKANNHLIKLFSQLFKVAKGEIELLSGESGRDKRIRIRSPRQMPPFIP